MKVFNPFIFDTNDDVELKQHEFGYEFFNVFKTPDKIVEFCRNDLVYQNHTVLQGYAPLYRVTLSFYIPPLRYFIKKIIKEYYNNYTIKNLDISSNICPLDIYKKKINSLPHLDNSVDIIFLFYLNKIKNGTMLWKNKYREDSASYRMSLVHDTTENLKQLTHECFESIGSSTGEYNSLFCFKSSQIPHNIDYWSTNLLTEDRLVIIGTSMLEKS